MTQLLLSVANLSYTYPSGARALTRVSFDAFVHECVILFGANGSGKTTFIRHLTGILRGDGHITVSGLPLNDGNLRQIRQKIGVVFQDPDDQLFMPTILDDVAFAPRAAGLPEQEALDLAVSALREVGITGGFERPPFYLSAGEKRRVAIAGVLAQNPEIIVLDEPTTFLDPPTQRTLAHTIRGLGQLRLIATHDVEFARSLGTRAVFFDSGRIVAEGSVSEIADRFNWRAF